MIVFPWFQSELRKKSCTDLAELSIGVRLLVSGFTRGWYKVVYQQIVNQHQKLVNMAWALFWEECRMRRSFDAYAVVKVLRDNLNMLYVKTVIMLIFITAK